MMNKSKIKITFNKIDVTKILFSNEIFLIILLIPFFKTSFFDKIPYLSSIMNTLLMIESMIFVIFSILLKKTSKFLFIIIIFEVWNYIIAPIFSINEINSVFYLCGTLGIISLSELAFLYNYKKYIKVLSDLFLIMIVLNFLLVIFHINIYNDSNDPEIYLFGIRTGFSLFIIPGLLICLFNDSINKAKKISLKTLMVLICGILSLVIKWVATGLVEIFIILTLYFIILKHKNTKFINVKKISVSIIIANFIISFSNSSNKILAKITNFLHKDVTLTGRTYIWEMVRKKININPFWGYGKNNLVDIYGVKKPAHNQFLAVILESGYIGFLIWIYGIILSLKELLRYRGTDIYKIITIFIIAILIACISEIQTYVPFLYLILEIPFLLKNIENIEECTIPKLF